MQEFLLDTGDPADMATTKDRLDDIEARLDAIDTRSSTSQPLSRETFWPKTWAARIGMLAAIVAIFTAVLGAFGYFGSLVLDRHIEASLSPIHGDIQRVDGDVQFIKGTLSVIQAEIAAQKLAGIPVTDLKNHRTELVAAKSELVNVPRDVPKFWPTSFQVLTLLTQATANVELKGQRESEFSNVSGPGIAVQPGQRILLRNRIANMVFEGDVVRLDPSVQLLNVTFINCVILFPAVEVPPQPLQEVGDALLAASDLLKLTIHPS